MLIIYALNVIKGDGELALTRKSSSYRGFGTHHTQVNMKVNCRSTPQYDMSLEYM